MLLGLLLTFWLLEVAVAGAAPLNCQTTRVYEDTRIDTAMGTSNVHGSNPTQSLDITGSIGGQNVGSDRYETATLNGSQSSGERPFTPYAIGGKGFVPSVVLNDMPEFPQQVALEKYLGIADYCL